MEHVVFTPLRGLPVRRSGTEGTSCLRAVSKACRPLARHLDHVRRTCSARHVIYKANYEPLAPLKENSAMKKQQ